MNTVTAIGAPGSLVRYFQTNPETAVEMMLLLQSYERWHGDLVLSDKAWDTKDGLPKLTGEFHDRLLELQRRSNVLIEKCPRRSGD